MEFATNVALIKVSLLDLKIRNLYSINSGHPIVFTLDLILFLDVFKLHRNAAISGHNTVRLDNVRVFDCKRQCSIVHWCKSFDYHKNINKCDLSNKNAAEVGGLKTNYVDNPYDHYERIPK